MVLDRRINYGQDFNYYKKISVTNTTFGVPADGYTQDVLIPFSTQALMLLNEDDADTVEYSFDGFNLHGELNPTLPSRGLAFDNRVVCKIWFRIKLGSSGPVSISVHSWSIR